MNSPADHPNIKEVAPFFLVSEMERSVKFYTEGLGFAIKYKWVVDGKLQWCWMELGGASMMLQEFKPHNNRTWAALGKVGSGVSLCFICKDAIAYYRELQSRGIPSTEPQVGNSMWEVSLTDPDGYNLTFESSTDVPEETKLSELKSA